MQHLLKQSQEKKETVSSIAASKICCLPHPQMEDTKVFLHFSLTSYKKAINPCVPRRQSDFDIHYTNVMSCLSKLSRGHHLSNLTCQSNEAQQTTPP